MSAPEARVTGKRRLAPIWIVPAVALALGVWMVVYTWMSQGPEIRIVFDTASGIEEGKTRIKFRNVDVGLVDTVALDDDLEHVVVTARIEPGATELLRESTQFWVVRPRVTSGGISGLSTVISGVYIQLEPGTEGRRVRRFVGLEDAPVTPAGTPGVKITLAGQEGQALRSGAPILYKGHRVGRIESAVFDVPSERMRYEAFVEAPYDDLVTTTSRFWNASGIALDATAEGIRIEAGDLESILNGGVAFARPDGMEVGTPIEDGATFEVYPDFESVNQRPHVFGVPYLVRFDRSIRGLAPGAPVEYRGIQIGRVERVLHSEVALGARGSNGAIPVLLRLEPGRLGLPDDETGGEDLARTVESAVADGLRATLTAGNLLTGRLFVALDLYPDARPAEITSFEGTPTLPAIASGLQGLEQKISALLDKLNQLPLEGTLRRLEQTVAEVNALIASEDVRGLPGSLDATLAELRSTLASVSGDSALQQRAMHAVVELERTLESVRRLSDTLGDQPNALVFPSRPPSDPEPPAGQP